MYSTIEQFAYLIYYSTFKTCDKSNQKSTSNTVYRRRVSSCPAISTPSRLNTSSDRNIVHYLHTLFIILSACLLCYSIIKTVSIMKQKFTINESSGKRNWLLSGLDDSFNGNNGNNNDNDESNVIITFDQELIGSKAAATTTKAQLRSGRSSSDTATTATIISSISDNNCESFWNWSTRLTRNRRSSTSTIDTQETVLLTCGDIKLQGFINYLKPIINYLANNNKCYVYQISPKKTVSQRYWHTDTSFWVYVKRTNNQRSFWCRTLKKR